MRRLAAVITLALMAGMAGACTGDATGPGDDQNAMLEELAILAFSAMQVGDGDNGLMGRLAQLPPEFALSADQLAQIGALIDAFIAATAAPREALAAIRADAAAARQAGKSPEEVRAILAAGAEIRLALHQAERALNQAIIGVLTPAQRMWLSGRTPPEPRPCALSEDQRNEISALRAAYEQANAADIALVRDVHDRARAAQQAGAPRAEIAAILAEARDAVQRLRAAREALHTAILGVLTPEQVAAGCMR
jgi:Spy/CpxP family protein refolding chaperone